MDAINMTATIKPKDVGFDAQFNPNIQPLMTHHFHRVDSHVYYIEYAVLAMVSANVVGLGGQINGESLFRLIQSPLVLTCAMFCRLAIFPAVSKSQILSYGPFQLISITQTI